MYYKNFALFIGLMIALTGCAVEMDSATAVPNFVTATLPPTAIPLPTRTPMPPTAIPTIPPVEGTTTTKLNVRAEPSTAGENLGMIAQFANVRVIGQDASGGWYRIMYADSSTGVGWVRAEYVRVDASAEIPVLGSAAGNGSAASGLVIQRINIRSGPGTNYESLGILNQNDVVVITGKDPGGKWIQIEFAGASDGKGWAALEFLRVDNLDSVPVIEATVQAETQPPAASTQAKAPLTAAQDGDSMQSPLVKVLLSPSGSRAFQINGDVSAPEGDAEDWIEFASHSETVALQVSCAGSALQVELWNNGKPVGDFSLTCGGKRSVKITPNMSYHLRLYVPNANESFYTNYVLSVATLR